MIQFSIFLCAILLMCLFFILGTWVDSVYLNNVIYTIYGYWILKIIRTGMDMYFSRKKVTKINEYFIKDKTTDINKKLI